MTRFFSLYFSGFNETVGFNHSFFLLHFLKEEDKPAEDEVLKTLVYSLDFRCALFWSVFVFGHVFF